MTRTIKVTGKSQIEVLGKVVSMKLPAQKLDFKRGKNGKWMTIINQ